MPCVVKTKTYHMKDFVEEWSGRNRPFVWDLIVVVLAIVIWLVCNFIIK